MIRPALVVLLALAASPVFAQHSPSCTPIVIPAPTDGNVNGLQGHVYFAPPPSAAERWGKITYPVSLSFPSGASSVGMMWLMAKTFVIEGYEAVRWGYTWLDPNQRYVVGQSGSLHVWRPGGIRFVWYPILPHAPVPDGSEPISAFRVTMDESDRNGYGINEALSTVLHTGEQAVLGVNVVAPYPEPIRVHLALHYRVCP